MARLSLHNKLDDMMAQGLGRQDDLGDGSGPFLEAASSGHYSCEDGVVDDVCLASCSDGWKERENGRNGGE
jgi:hypothetical protein